MQKRVLFLSSSRVNTHYLAVPSSNELRVTVIITMEETIVDAMLCYSILGHQAIHVQAPKYLRHNLHKPSVRIKQTHTASSAHSRHYASPRSDPGVGCRVPPLCCWSWCERLDVPRRDRRGDSRHPAEVRTQGRRLLVAGVVLVVLPG